MTAAHIHTATLADLPAVAQLFDAYRQFYQYPSDLALASAYIAQRMQKGESVVLLACDGAGARDSPVDRVQFPAGERSCKGYGNNESQ